VPNNRERWAPSIGTTVRRPFQVSVVKKANRIEVQVPVTERLLGEFVIAEIELVDIERTHELDQNLARQRYEPRFSSVGRRLWGPTSNATHGLDGRAGATRQLETIEAQSHALPNSTPPAEGTPSREAVSTRAVSLPGPGHFPCESPTA
jgi:hypothetical protein